MSSWRHKITLVHERGLRTFVQLAEGESLDEFRARAVSAMHLREGEMYYHFELEGHVCSGPVHEHVHGTKHVYRSVGQDDRLPGLFLLRDGQVKGYRDVPTDHL